MYWTTWDVTVGAALRGRPSVHPHRGGHGGPPLQLLSCSSISVYFELVSLAVTEIPHAVC